MNPYPAEGLCVEQGADWREARQRANEAPAERDLELREQGKSDRKEIKQLKKDLQLKEKALAEAAVLTNLRKKGQAIWGSPRMIDQHPRSPAGDCIG